MECGDWEDWPNPELLASLKEEFTEDIRACLGGETSELFGDGLLDGEDRLGCGKGDLGRVSEFCG